MAVLPEGGEMYTVVGENGSTYTVDARVGRCTCPDAQYNLGPEERCKHERRVLYAVGDRPAPVDVVDVDGRLGEHVDDGPVFVSTDGGEIVVAGDDGEILEDVDVEERPEDCDCRDIHENAELPCFACHRAGFETVAE
jgi:hypothetical protein